MRTSEIKLEEVLTEINNSDEDYNSPDSPFNGPAGEYLVLYCTVNYPDRPLHEVVNELLIGHLLRTLVEKGALEPVFENGEIKYDISRTLK